MKRKLTRALLTAFIILGQPMLGGCSLISAGLTAADNAASARKASLSLQELDAVEPGTPLVIQLGDGSEMRGTYAGYAGNRSLLILKVSEQELQVPVSDVVGIRTVEKRHNVWASFLTAAAIDLAFLYTVTHLSFGVGFGD